MVTEDLPEAGWYDDPVQGPVQRYWNGEQWTPLLEDPNQIGVGQARRSPDPMWPPPLPTGRFDSELEGTKLDHGNPARSRWRLGAILVLTVLAIVAALRFRASEQPPALRSGKVEVSVIPNSCQGGDNAGSVRLKVQNGTSIRSAVTITVNFFDAQKTNIGEGIAVLPAMDPGFETEVDVIGVLADDYTLATCELNGVLIS